MSERRDIDRVFDQCVTSVFERGRTVAACLEQYPDQRDDLESLLNLAVALQSVRTVQPSPEFREVAGVRMQNLLASRPRNAQPSANGLGPESRRSWLDALRLPRARALALVTALIFTVWLLVGGAVVALAEDSLPGEPLYSVKLAVENSQLALTTDQEAKANLHLRVAERRTDEAALLIAGSDADVAVETIATMTAHVEFVIELLEQDDRLTIMEKRAIARDFSNRLEVIDAQVRLLWVDARGPMRAAIVAALDALERGRAAVQAVLGEVPDGPAPIVVPSNTPTPTDTTTTPSPTATRTPVPTPTVPPETATLPPTPTLADIPSRAEDTPSDWIDGCLPSGRVPGSLPEYCLDPRFWPTVKASIPPVPSRIPPVDWPEDCPIPSEWPADWPEGCPFPPDWPDDLGPWTPPPPPADGWVDTPSQLPTLPADWPTPPADWPDEWPTPPVDWPDIPEDIPTPPADWPDWPDIPDEFPPLPDPPDMPDDLPQPPDSIPVPPPDGSWPGWP